VTDAIPAAITGTAINCVASGTASCGTNASVGNNLSFTGLNIPAGAGNFLTITANGTVNIATTGNLVNTATVNVGAGQTDSVPANNTATDTDTANVQTDLSVTKTDGATAYTPGNPITYTIVVSNAGPANAIGVSVDDVIPAAINGTTITCTASGAATCGTDASAGNNLSFTGVNIPAGAANFVTITVDGTVDIATTGSLINTVTVTEGAGQTDPDASNNTATDIDYGSIYGDIGTGKDDVIEILPNGTSLILALSPQLQADGDVGTVDLIYYEQAVFGGIDMDRIILEIGDGTTWYTVLNWGDGASDLATNIAVDLGPPNPTTCTGEPDNCSIDASFLDLGTGITIDIDHPSLGIPAGTYPFIRITVPLGSGNVGIDGFLVVFPP
jgi:uncharacterized repeat protein (TIGR01451 family)